MGSFKNSNGVNFVSHGKEHSPTLKGNVPEVIDGKYELVRKINSGGMGDIYEAKHKILSKKVAIKFLKPELLDKKEIIERFYNEAKIAASLSTYNVVDVLDIGFHKEIPYIIMEFLEGITLEEYLKQCIPFDLKSAVKFISPVCKTIDKIHAKGIIHRDLKPSNLMIVKKEDREIVKILDFGISLFKTGSAYKRLTMTGAVLGTPSYMSPEQAMGKKEIDYRTDIYSLGAILYEMFTLRPPFEGDNYNQIITTIITQDITNPKNLNPSLDDSVCAVLLKAMAKDPEQRYRTSTEISEELNAILQKMPSEKGKSIQTPVSSIILPEAKVSAKTNEGVKTIPIVSYPTQEKEEKLQEKASKSSNWLAKSAIITGTLLVIIIGGFLIFNSIITKSTIKKKNNDTTAESKIIPLSPNLNKELQKQEIKGEKLEEKEGNELQKDNKMNEVRTVMIVTNPQNATIFLNGEKIGKSPVKYQISGETALFEAELPGYEKAILNLRIAEIKDGEKFTMNLNKMIKDKTKKKPSHGIETKHEVESDNGKKNEPGLFKEVN